MTTYYVYRVTNKITGQYYIGSRTTALLKKRSPEDDLWHYYFSSCPSINQWLKDSTYSKDDFTAEVLIKDTEREGAYWKEQIYIHYHIRDPLCLNTIYQMPKADAYPALRGGWASKNDRTKDAISKTKSGVKQSPQHIANRLAAHNGQLPTHIGNHYATGRPVKTPLGTFPTVSAAQRSHAITGNQMYRLLKNDPQNYYYLK